MRDYNEKLNRYKAELKKKNIDAVLICNLSNKDKHFYYFTELDIECCFLLILAKQDKVVVYTSILEAERVKRILPYEVIVLNKPISAEIKKVVKKEKLKTIAMNYDSITINEYNKFASIFNKLKIKTKVNIVDCSSLLKKLRQQKTEEEIHHIKTACKITDAVFTAVIDNFNTFKTELDIKSFINKKFTEFFVDEAFPTIVASGKNAAIPHYSSNPTPEISLSKGFCVIDFGCKYKEYCADMTRTIFIGTPTEKEIKLYNTVLESKKAAEKAVFLNKKCSIVDAAARKKLGKFQKHFIHSLGHGIGLAVHESPHLSSKSNDIFLENAVFTIEPGIYFSEKLGIRIEDDYIITKNGIEKLTKSKEELIVVKINNS